MVRRALTNKYIHTDLLHICLNILKLLKSSLLIIGIVYECSIHTYIQIHLKITNILFVGLL